MRPRTIFCSFASCSIVFISFTTFVLAENLDNKAPIISNSKDVKTLSKIDHPVTANFYDSQGRITSSRSSDGTVIHYSYDANGKQISETKTPNDKIK